MSRIHWGLKVLLCAVILGRVATAVEHPTPVRTSTATGIIDLSLTSIGNITGRYIDNEGRAIEGARVVISQGSEVIAQTSTDKAGAYQLSAIRSGSYQLSVGNVTHLVRVWPESLAPSAARPHLTTIRSDRVIRGQFGGGGALDLGLIFGITGVAIGTVAIVEANDANEEADKLRQQMNAMSDTGGPVSP